MRWNLSTCKFEGAQQVYECPVCKTDWLELEYCPPFHCGAEVREVSKP